MLSARPSPPVGGGRENGSLPGWIRANGCPVLVFALVFLVRETVSFRVCNLPVAYSAEGGGGSFPDESPCVLDTGQIDGRAPFETVAFMDGDSHQALLEFSGADIASVSAGSGEMGRYYKVCLAPKAGEDFRKMTKKQLYRVVEIYANGEFCAKTPILVEIPNGKFHPRFLVWVLTQSR